MERYGWTPLDRVYLQNMLNCPRCEKRKGMMAQGGRGYEDERTVIYMSLIVPVMEKGNKMKRR